MCEFGESRRVQDAAKKTTVEMPQFTCEGAWLGGRPIGKQVHGWLGEWMDGFVDRSTIELGESNLSLRKTCILPIFYTFDSLFLLSQCAVIERVFANAEAPTKEPEGKAAKEKVKKKKV